jgi:hypothetical protein
MLVFGGATYGFADAHPRFNGWFDPTRAYRLTSTR